MLKRKRYLIGWILLCASLAACDNTETTSGSSSGGMGGEGNGASGGMGGTAGAGGSGASGGIGGTAGAGGGGASGGMGGTAGAGGGGASGGMGGTAGAGGGGGGGASGGMGGMAGTGGSGGTGGGGANGGMGGMAGTGGSGGSGAVDCSVSMQTGCDAGLVCEEVANGKPGCFAPLTIRGKVLDAMAKTALEGARVLARDTNESAISVAVFTAADGSYSLNVPAKRNMQGQPIPATVSLRVEAAGHQPFPFAPRLSVPIDLATAVGDPPIVQNASTDVALFAYPNMSGFGSVAGKIMMGTGPSASGATVVAGGAASIVDRNGEFVVYNAMPGNSVTVRAFAAGVQIAPKDVAVAAGMQTSGVQLQVTGMATAKVMGNVQLVNVPAGIATTVALMLPDTYLTPSNRGETPKGLRVANVINSYEITGVPDGTYKVMATFENDGLVRDPDTSLPSVQDIVVNGQDILVAQSAKLTGALAVISPGATGIEMVMGTPTFQWADDTAEDQYELSVFDALGASVWTTNLPGVSGMPTVSATYAGPQLVPGMVYQFRATSKKSLSSISQTEDLRGIFIVGP